MGQAAHASPPGSEHQLTLRVRAVLDEAGLPFDPEAHERRLRACQASSEPVAREVLELLERARPVPETDAEYSLLAAVDTMAAFGCSVADEACRLIGAPEAHDVRRIVSVYVVGSAIFDHICDRESALVPVLRERLSVARLEAALQGRADPALADDDDPGLLAFLDALLAELVRRLSELVDGDPREQIIQGLLEAHRAELRSISPDGERQAGTIWATPFWLALRLAAASSSAPPTGDLAGADLDARAIGELLSLIDDVVDLADDWASGSANQLLGRAELAGGHGGCAEPPWEVLLADGVCGPYMDEVRDRVRALPPSVSRDSLAAWLHHWLSRPP